MKESQQDRFLCPSPCVYFTNNNGQKSWVASKYKTSTTCNPQYCSTQQWNPKQDGCSIKKEINRQTSDSWAARCSSGDDIRDIFRRLMNPTSVTRTDATDLVKERLINGQGNADRTMDSAKLIAVDRNSFLAMSCHKALEGEAVSGLLWQLTHACKLFTTCWPV